MNNPGIDSKIWEQLREKWTNLDKGGHKIKVDFRMIAHPNDENKILVIDVIQYVDDELVTETVQQSTEEALASLGIDGLSMERLVGLFQEMMHELYRQAGQRGAEVAVTMTPRTLMWGETRGELEIHDIKRSVLVNYRHYCILNALREKMIESFGDPWNKVRAVYSLGELEFYFDY